MNSSGNIRVLIADDEKMSRDLIEKYALKYCKGLEIVAKAKDANEAIAKIQEFKPDLVFLDVEMPFGNAFDVLEGTSELEFQTIFITAYSEYAIKAFNYSAAYYILKPINIEELVKAVDKAKELIAKGETSVLKEVLKQNLQGDGIQRIVVPDQQGFEIIQTADIVRISGNGNYSDIYLKSGKKKTISKVLKFFSDLEDQNGFMRIHRSHIINLSCVTAYRKGRGGTVILTDDSEVEVSESKKKQLLDQLGV
ncbi:response regulator transcription factor [bacterium]|nr:response regulator transcription factor [bacterium]